MSKHNEIIAHQLGEYSDAALVQYLEVIITIICDRFIDFYTSTYSEASGMLKIYLIALFYNFL
jgi:hypothetical protein